MAEIMAGILLTIHDIPLSLTNSGVPPIVQVKQYDRGARVIRCGLYQGKTAYDLPDDITVSCCGVTTGGSPFSLSTANDSMWISGNRILIPVIETMTEHAGVYPVDVVLTDTEGRILRTFCFLMSVEPCAVARGRNLKKTFSSALDDIHDTLVEVFITDDGYLAIRCDDGTFLPPGSASDLASIIYNELVCTEIENTGKTQYTTADRYGLSFEMDELGRLLVGYNN